MLETKKSILQRIDLEILKENNIQLFIKRDDLIDELISGNKWRKLKYNVEYVKQSKKEGIITFGGAFSNHLLATAAACKLMGLKSIGVIRGEELNKNSNDTLIQCSNFGMDLQFVSREEYLMKDEKSYHDELCYNNKNFHIVPEGGSNYYGMIGCQEILQETPNDYDHIFVAQGTTTTSTGIALGLNEKSKLHVVPVLKGFDSKLEMKNLYMKSGIEQGMYDEILSRTDVLNDYHFGGYAKYTTELLDFMEFIFQETKIPLDPIYTGKVFYAMIDWIKINSISNVKILFIHTGGIQGGKYIEKKEGRTFS